MKLKPPSVTQVLRETGAAVLYPDFRGIPEETLDLKRRLGTNVHRLCALAGTKRAGLKLPDNPSADYTRQFVKWLEKTGARVLRSEFEVKGNISGRRFVGHPDLELEWNKELWIVDLKTSLPNPSHGVQLAAYCFGLEAPTRCVYRRAVLLLTPSAAKILAFKDETDFDVWQACLTLWYWRRNHGK
jgi:hypothetical protein